MYSCGRYLNTGAVLRLDRSLASATAAALERGLVEHAGTHASTHAGTHAGGRKGRGSEGALLVNAFHPKQVIPFRLLWSHRKDLLSC